MFIVSIWKKKEIENVYNVSYHFVWYHLCNKIYEICYINHVSKVKHGEKLLAVNVLKKLIDKDIRNKLSILKTKKVKGMEKALQYWFSTRV